MVPKLLPKILLNSLLIFHFQLDSRALPPIDSKLELPPEFLEFITEAIEDPTFKVEFKELSLTELLTCYDRGYFILEHFGQVLTTDQNGRYNKKDGLPSIKKVKQSIKKIQELCFEHVTEHTLNTLNEYLSLIIGYIATAFDSKLQTFPAIDLKIERILIPTRSKTKTPPLEVIHTEIQKNKMYIDILYKEADKVGLSLVNRGVRTLEQINDKLHISSIIKRSLPYIGLTTWLILMTDEKQIDEWGLPLLSRIRRFLGGTPTIVEVYTMKVDATESKQKSTNFNPNIKERKLINRGGVVGTPLYMLDNLVHFQVEPFLTLGVGGLLLEPIKKDFKDLYTWLRKKWQSTQNNLRGSHTMNKNTHDVKKPQVIFNDIVGLSQAKKLLTDVVRYISDPDRFDRSGTSIGRGYLLSGPTRTGKTFIAEALAGEINRALLAQGKVDKCGFKEVKWWDLMQKDGIKAVIESAKKDAPCVLFIDELDLLKLKREGDNITLSEFLTGMSGLDRDDRHRVILIGATNRIEHIDSALLQHGRFGTIIHFENPRINDRIKFFETSLQKLTIDTEEFNLVHLARETEGNSFGDLEAIVRYAQFKAKIAGERLSQKHLQDAIDQKTKHIMEFTHELTESERKVLATYQAAVALAYILLEPEEKLQCVTICPISKIREKSLFFDIEKQKKKNSRKTITYGKVFTYRKNETIRVHNKNEKIKQCKIFLSGHIGEQLLLGSRSPSYRPKDKQRALNIAKEIVFDGIKDVKQNISKETREQLLCQSFELVQKLEQEMIDLLSKHQDWIALIAEYLEQELTLSIQEILALIQPQEQSIEFPEEIIETNTPDHLDLTATQTEYHEE